MFFVKASFPDFILQFSFKTKQYIMVWGLFFSGIAIIPVTSTPVSPDPLGTYYVTIRLKKKNNIASHRKRKLYPYDNK